MEEVLTKKINVEGGDEEEYGGYIKKGKLIVGCYRHKNYLRCGTG